MNMTLPEKVGVAYSVLAAIMGFMINVSIPASEAQAAPGELTELSIEELLTVEVYSASKFVQKTTEAPASVSIITAEDIKIYGYRTLADILRSVRGMFVTYDRNYQYLGVRGFNRPGDYNSRILLMVDGYRVNDAIYDTASIGMEFSLDVDLIDRVEVIRGPGSSIYGSNAFFGVVNIITKRGRDFNGLEISGEAASFGTGKGRLTYGRQFNNGAEALLSATYSDSKGQNLFFPEFNTPSTNNGIARGLDGETARRVYGKLAFGEFILTAAYSERVKDVPTASYGSLFNAPTQTTDSAAVLDLGYYRRLSERLDLSARLYYGGYFYKADYPYDVPPVIVNKDQSRGEWWGTEAKLTSRYDRHKLVAGAEFQDNFHQNQKNFDVDPFAVYLDDKHRSNRAALYFQDEITLTQGLLLNAGLRYDYYSTVGGTFNPRLALIYSPRQDTALKFLYGTAFRAPNALELYYATGSDSKANPSLKPEKITSYEFVVEHELQPNFRIIAMIYQNEIRDLVNQVIDPADDKLVYQNTRGLVKAKGIEFEAERAWVGGTRLRVSYAWQITRDESTGEELENSPRHLAKLNFSMPIFSNALRTGTELQYTSSRKTLSGGTTGGYTIVNLTLLTQKLAKGMELSASAYNLFDRHYADPGRPEHIQDVIQQDGRNFRVKLSYRF